MEIDITTDKNDTDSHRPQQNYSKQGRGKNGCQEYAPIDQGKPPLSSWHRSSVQHHLVGVHYRDEPRRDHQRYLLVIKS